MSGLATFFRDSICVDGETGAGAAATPPEEFRYLYSTSLEDVRPPDGNIDGSALNDTFDKIQVEEFLESRYHEPGDDWSQWKRRCKDQLAEYIERRILPSGRRSSLVNPGDTGAGLEESAGVGGKRSSDSNNGPDDSSEDEDFYSLATGVINVRDTKYDVAYLSDVNESTRRLVSCNAVVTRILDVRFAQRASLRRTTRRNWSVDGPLALGYTRVVSLEVKQWLRGEENGLRQRARNCMNEKPKTRVVIFLYQNWACSFEKILKQRPESTSTDPPLTLLLRLENIPACCIFPYNDLDWSDRDMVSYCICVGDNSPKIKIGGFSTRFDDGVLLKFQYCSGWSEYPHSASGIDSDLPVAPRTVYSLEPSGSGVEFEGEDELAPLFGSVARPLTSVPSEEAPAKTNPTSSTVNTTTQTITERVSTGVGNTLAGGATSPARRRTSNRQPDVSSPIGRNHSYRTLAQLLGIIKTRIDHEDEKRVDLFAVVLGFSAPRLTKRGDWMVSAALVDSSISVGAGCPEATTITMNMFNSDRNRLPDLRYAGDAIRIHRARVEVFKEEVQLVGMKMTSYVVFRGDSEDVTRDNRWTVSAVAKGYVQSYVEKARFVQLWKWGQNRIFTSRTLKGEHYTRICDIMKVDDTVPVEGYRDFTVMVCAVYSIPQDPSTVGVTPRGLLRVWDGTGPPMSDPVPPIVPLDVTLEMNNMGEPSSFCVDRLARIIRRVRESKSDFAVKEPLALTGRVVNVAVWEDSHWELVTSAVKVGSFVRLRNVRESILFGTGVRCLQVSSMSYLSPLPDLTFEVVEVLNDHNSRLDGGVPTNPMSGVLSLQPNELPPGMTVDTTSSALQSDQSATQRSSAPCGAFNVEPVEDRTSVIAGTTQAECSSSGLEQSCIREEQQSDDPRQSNLRSHSKVGGHAAPSTSNRSSTETQQVKRQSLTPGAAASKRMCMSRRKCLALRDLLLAPAGSEFVGSARVFGTYPAFPSTLDHLISRESGAGTSPDKLVWRFAVSLGDDGSACLVAIVSDAAGEAMIGMSANDATSDRISAVTNLEKLVGKCQLVAVRSGICDNYKYFFIDDVYREAFHS